MVEHLVKRTLWVSEYPKCGDRVEKDENPPRVPYVEQFYIGKDFSKEK